jgi:DNA damage-binding protein 1
MDTYTNLGPITDLCVVDLERQGQGQVVTTSGVGADGTLRVVRNGIGINEQATVEVPGIKGMWSLRRNMDDRFDEFLLVTFISETRLLVRVLCCCCCCVVVAYARCSYQPRPPRII